MSDGPMAIPVSPTEDEAMNLSLIFSKAANALVNASTMPKTIEDLTRKVESLQEQLNTKSLHAEQLDKSLADMRSERDQVKYDLRTLGADYDVIGVTLNRAQDLNEKFQARVDTLESVVRERNETIDKLRSERDDNGYHVMELQEKLDNVERKFSELFGLVKPQEPKTPEPPAPSMPELQAAVQEPRPQPDHYGPTPDNKPSQEKSWLDREIEKGSILYDEPTRNIDKV
jgi:predicted nuclease with TOPRIM domain